MDVPFIVLDLETTGLSVHRDKVTEIAAVKIQDGEIIDEFHTLINPQMEIPRFITRLTGIDNELVKDAPKIESVLPELKSFLDSHIVVAHNASFDSRFLAHNFLFHHNHYFDNPLLCTRKLANRLVDIPKKRLADLCDYFNLENELAHRAMSDVLVTKDILHHMLTILSDSNITSSNEILSFQNLPRVKATQLLLE